jgi:hypothetical protein
LTRGERMLVISLPTITLLAATMPRAGAAFMIVVAE